MSKRKLTLATRRWRRQFNRAVEASIAKTITEPVTNSYDSYKRMYGARDATTGLVDRILGLNVGTQLLHSDLVKGLPKRPGREIRVRYSNTATAKGLEKRQCQVIDSAEGMSVAEMEDKFEKYGADKSGAGTGHAVRGLFGQGICDVVYSHDPGQILSFKNASAGLCVFTWEGASGREEPIYDITALGKATKKLREQGGVPSGNGTSVSFVLDDACRVPSPENLLARLSGFYMLQLINADPHCTVILEQTRADGVQEERLNYNFPTGQVIGKFSVDIEYPKYKPIKAEVVVVRADASLPTRDSGDERANGLLIVDEADTVYDQTLFGYDTNPYLDQIYGLVRLTGVRDIIRDRLNAGEALLTESRDGFDPKCDLYKTIDEALKQHLEPVLKKEIDRRLQPTKVLSEVAEKKIKRAFQKLNELFEDVTKQQYDGAPGGVGTKVPEVLEFEELHTQLRVGQPRRIRLLANAARFQVGSHVISDSDNPSVRVEPTSTVLGRSANDRILSVVFTLTGSALGAQATIVALAQDSNGKSEEAKLQVVDVTLPEVLQPPEAGLEFSPKAARSAPNRLGSLSLLINPLVVPVGTPIVVHRSKGDAAVCLVGEDIGDTDRIEVQFNRDFLLPGGAVGRIPLAFRGYGFGQKAWMTADCFPKPKFNVRAEASVSIEEPRKSSGGVFRDIDYTDLPGSFAKNASEFEPSSGTILINRLHPVNRAAFGVDLTSFRVAIDTDRPAQFRLAHVVVDQCLYHMMAVAYRNSEVVLDNEDPVSSMRRSLELFRDRDQVEVEVFRQFVDGFRVPKLPEAR